MVVLPLPEDPINAVKPGFKMKSKLLNKGF